ncbi:MAG: NAD-dependent epimerase/dehydratase family protein, partial [Mycobacteriaceae bacterium]
MKIAVTGAAGFLGTNLVNQLVEDGHDVTGVDRVRSEHAPKQVKWVLGDVLDPDAMVRALDGAELVYHLIAMITLAHLDEKAWTVNTVGVRTVAEAARTVGVRRMVHCSSVHSFDQYALEGELDENTPRSTASSIPVYDRSKWAGEQELGKVIVAGLDAVICNPTGVYGPVDYGPSRINGMLRDAARGR